MQDRCSYVYPIPQPPLTVSSIALANGLRKNHCDCEPCSSFSSPFPGGQPATGTYRPLFPDDPDAELKTVTVFPLSSPVKSVAEAPLGPGRQATLTGPAGDLGRSSSLPACYVAIDG